MDKLHLLGSLCACVITQIVSTPVHSAAVFPSEIQECISATVCSTPTLVQQAPTFSAYSYSDGGESKFLFEYNLFPTSNESTNFSTTPLSGDVWVSANASYDLTQERHFFTLYLDGVTPTPTNLWLGDSDGLDVELSMPTSDLLAGSSFFRLGEDQSGAGGFFLEGELGTLGDLGQGFYPLGDNHSFVPCLADTCEVGAEFNLLYMQYTQVGDTSVLSINEADQRGILYSQYQDWDGDDTWYVSQSYEVVPIPPAVWLFGSGLIGLIGIARRKKDEIIMKSS
jgi:hypothetical protein